jgi:exodeoxyribonuclease V gamma subunit
MLQIRFSNQFETLLDALLDRMASPPASPFVREEIIVPSAAVRRRIELSAADRFGICANVQFSFLAEWLWRQIGQVIDVAPVSPFKTPVLTWRVFQILGDAKFVRDHPPLATYLRDADAIMRHDLAVRVAGLFEQYLTYRPDWLAAWLDHKLAPFAKPAPDEQALQQDERWQAALWRRIAAEIGTGRQHPSVAFFEAVAAMGAEAPGRAALPPVAHVFCLPTMPPLYLSILQGLGRWIELHLYVLNPSREDWFEIVDPRRLSYLQVTEGIAHHEVGNRLLASWGKQTRAHIDLLFDKASDAVIDDAFVPATPAAGAGTLLAGVQDAILDLVDPAPGSLQVGRGDRSIEVHVCHSLTRELEVLQDQLLATFAGAHPPLPADILVLTPNLQDAAPLIDAVFGTAPRARRIPFAITGRPASSQNPAARALLAVLAVARSRFPASAVFELLQQPIIARRFDIGADELDTIHRWIRQAGIRWAIDGEQRAGLKLPNLERHTFADGLDRLFMGYALPAVTHQPLNDRLPAGGAEGSEALALGSFQHFVGRLEQLRGLLGTPQKPLEWRQTLLDATATFLAPIDDEIEHLREVEAGIRDLQANMTQGGADGPIPADVLVTALQREFDDPTRGGVPTGAVTFSSMASLRNLPYRCIHVIGLNDGVFPSTSRPDEFDLMAFAPRRGDRQRRLDERNLFLDILLAARDRLCLSYTGRSVRDNAVLPPSVLVAELLDYVATASAATPVSPETIKAARDALIVEHPLQPFSAAYFDPQHDPRRRSFNDEYRAALSERFRAPFQVPPPAPVPGASQDYTPAEDEDLATEAQGTFFRSALDIPGPEFREATLSQLERFFFNPSHYLLRERLGIDFGKAEDELQDDEPFVSDWPGQQRLAERVLPHLLAGAAPATIAALARAGIEYPPGRLGEIELEHELQRLGEFAERVRADTREPCLPPVSHRLDLVVDGESWSLSGAFSDLRATGLIRYRYDDVRPNEYVNGWLAHLFLNALADAGGIGNAARQTTWHSRNGQYTLAPVSDAAARLTELLALYRKGLRRPLHFYPRSAWMYATTKRFSEAYKAWRTTPYRTFPGEDQRSPAYPLALRGVDDPLDDEFIASATTVFAPLLEKISDLRLR